MSTHGYNDVLALVALETQDSLNSWDPMKAHTTPLEAHGSRWKPMGTHGQQWVPMGFHGQGYESPWEAMSGVLGTHG